MIPLTRQGSELTCIFFLLTMSQLIHSEVMRIKEMIAQSISLDIGTSSSNYSVV